LLIFCFRWRDLVEGGDNDDEHEHEQDALAGLPKRTWIAELSVVQRVVACPLQPLKVLAFSARRLS
jgi:RNA polymerase I-specific transcription initiation factor RRN3